MSRNEFILCLIVLGSVILSFLLGVMTEKTHRNALGTQKDTIVVESIKVDTIRLVEPIFETKRVVERMEVMVTDTIVRHDTTFVSLEREQKRYSNPYYDAWISGYNPHLDSIKLYQKTKTITKEIPVEKKVYRKWDFGLQGGYGIVIPNGDNPRVGGYIGVGVTRHF